MKRCPECRRDYTDETLNFCLDDGAALLEGPGSTDESPTAILHSTDAPDAAPTRAQIHTTNQTEVLPSNTGEARRKSFRLDKRMLIVSSLVAISVLGILFGYRYFGTAKSKQIDSIAVMPFVNDSGNVDLEYLSDGMTESLINSLSQLSNLSVKARSSVFRYKGKDVDPQQIAAELKVQAVLNGRVAQRGESLIVSLDLVDAYTGNQIWGEQYNRKTGDLTALQSEIARDVSDKLRGKLFGTEKEQIEKKPTENAEAYQLYLKGRYYWNKRTEEGNTKAIEFFNQAIERDPVFALAHVGLADSYFIGSFKGLSDAERMARSKAAALRALEIDEKLGEAHTTLASYKHWEEWNWPEAEKEYKRAIELNPNYSTAHHWYAEALASQGRFEESFAEYNRALELDPFSLAISTDLGAAYGHARQYDRAIEHLKKLEEMDPNFVRTHFYLGDVYEAKGMIHEASVEYEHGSRLSGADMEKFGKAKSEILNTFDKFGIEGYRRKIIELINRDAVKDGKPLDHMKLAELHSLLLERDRAFEHLEKAFEERRSDLRWLKVTAEFDPIRDDPRFMDLLKRTNLAQ